MMIVASCEKIFAFILRELQNGMKGISSGEKAATDKFAGITEWMMLLRLARRILLSFHRSTENSLVDCPIAE
jgi:hypothetical protein